LGFVSWTHLLTTRYCATPHSEPCGNTYRHSPLHKLGELNSITKKLDATSTELINTVSAFKIESNGIDLNIGDKLGHSHNPRK
jgi:hypothetical protein